MKYEVIRDFHDAQDAGHSYHAGDLYPRDGVAPSDQRIKDLLSENNFYNVAVIKPYNGEPKEVKVEVPKENPKVEMPEEKPEAEPKEDENAGEVVWTEEDINKMPFMKLKSVAKQNGIDVEDKKAAEIRAELIAKLVEG